MLERCHSLTLWSSSRHIPSANDLSPIAHRDIEVSPCITLDVVSDLRGHDQVVIVIWAKPKTGAVINIEVLAEEGSLITHELTIKPMGARCRALSRLGAKDILKEPSCDCEDQASGGEETKDDEGVSGGVAHESILVMVMNWSGVYVVSPVRRLEARASEVQTWIEGEA